MKISHCLCVLLLSALLSSAADSGQNVMVIFNTEMKGSREVAEHYAAKRNVPSNNVIGLSLPTAESISRDDYNSMVLRPLLKETEKRKLLNFKMEAVPTTNGKAGDM